MASMEGPVGACFTDRGVTAMRSAPAQVARAHQATLDRIEGSLRSALQLELSEDVAHVGLYRLLTDVELACHLLVCLSLREESKHGRFALCQHLGASWNLHLPHQSGGGLRGQVGLAPGRRPDRLTQLVRLR